MKAIIESTKNGYGFGMDWTLVCSTAKVTKRFYLGQDAKACQRILGMSASQVADYMGRDSKGSVDLSKLRNKRKLGRIFAHKFRLNGWNIRKAESWEFSAQ